VLIPWSRFWEHNYFGDLMPALQFVITNNYVRGAISGLELGAIIVRREDVVSPRQEG
jgi:hypothetical protein